MKTSEIILPNDFYRPNMDIGMAYQQEAGSESEARFKRMDLTYAAYLDELPKGEAGVSERVAKRLQVDTGTKSARTTIGDAIRIFSTFRLGGEQGLGFSREKLTTIPVSRLRAVAQNRKWALANRDKVDEALTLPEKGDYTIRDFINDNTPEEERRAAKKAADNFAERKIRMTLEDASGFDTLVTAVQAKMHSEGIDISDNDSTALGQILLYALTDWLQADTLVYDDKGHIAVQPDGTIMTTSNITFFTQTTQDDDELNGAAD